MIQSGSYGALLALAFLVGLFMFMLPMFMFACSLAFTFAWMLAFALFVFAEPVLAVAGVAARFALPAVFELLAVEQPAQKAVAASKRANAMVRRIEVPPVCKRHNGHQRSQSISVVPV